MLIKNEFLTLFEFPTTDPSTAALETIPAAQLAALRNFRTGLDHVRTRKIMRVFAFEIAPI